MTQVFKITNGLTIAEYVSRNMRLDDEEIPGRNDLAEWDETPQVDPPTNPIRQTGDGS